MKVKEALEILGRCDPELELVIPKYKHNCQTCSCAMYSNTLEEIIDLCAMEEDQLEDYLKKDGRKGIVLICDE